MHGHFALILTVLAASAYLCVGAAFLDKAMSHIYRQSGFDADYRRMAHDDSRKIAAMRVAQLAVLAGWPVAVSYAIIANQRRQFRQMRGFATA